MKINKISKLVATGLFVIALAINIKVTLDDPFVMFSEEVIAQTTSGTETGTGPKYYSTNPFDKSGSETDEYGQKWCWTWKGDACNKKGDNCPNGIVDNFNQKKC